MKEEIRHLNNMVANLLGERATIKMGKMYYSSFLDPFYFSPDQNVFSRIYHKIKYRKEMQRCLEIKWQIDNLFSRINHLQKMIDSEETIGMANFNPECKPI